MCWSGSGGVDLRLICSDCWGHRCKLAQVWISSFINTTNFFSVFSSMNKSMSDGTEQGDRLFFVLSLISENPSILTLFIHHHGSRFLLHPLNVPRRSSVDKPAPLNIFCIRLTTVWTPTPWWVTDGQPSFSYCTWTLRSMWYLIHGHCCSSSGYSSWTAW